MIFNHPLKNGDRKASLEPQDELFGDPIGTLARLAGYEDGEAWWNDFIEQNLDTDEDIFSAIESAMQALRAELPQESAQ